MKIKKSQLEYLIRKNIKHVLNEDYDYYDNPDPDEEEPEEIEPDEDPNVAIENKINDGRSIVQSSYNKLLKKNKNSNGLRQVPGSILDNLKKGKVLHDVYENIVECNNDYTRGIFPLIPMITLTYDPLEAWYGDDGREPDENDPNVAANVFIDGMPPHCKYPLFDLMKFGDLMIQSGIKTFDFYYTNLGFLEKAPYLIFSHDGEEPSRPSGTETDLLLYCIDKSFDYVHYPYLNIFSSGLSWYCDRQTSYPADIADWQYSDGYNRSDEYSGNFGNPYPKIKKMFVQKFC